MNKLSKEIEKLSSKFHDVYMKEARKQGHVRHKDKYEDLEENIKEYDRVLARYVLANFGKPKVTKEFIEKWVGKINDVWAGETGEKDFIIKLLANAGIEVKND